MLYGYSQFYCIHKTGDIYKDIAKEVETRFHTSNYEWDRPLPKGKNKKALGLMKDELGEEIMTEFACLKAKTFGYFTLIRLGFLRVFLSERVNLTPLHISNRTYLIST